MFGKRITLFELLGFKVNVDLSWVLLAVLVVWSLAQGYFPAMHEGLPIATYWSMAVVGAAGLFLSLILHELSHSVVARQYGLQIKGITLFIFGGVAEMEEEPPSAKAEFLMAIAGPIASLALAAGFYVLALAAAAAGLPEQWIAVPRYLALINGILAVFNMVPAFPLDGGRAFRAALWHYKGNPQWATRIAARVGSAFGMALIFLGVFSVLTGNFVGGMWWFLIGMFIRGAAASSYQQLVTRRAMEGEKVRRFMSRDPVTVAPGTTLQAFVEDYLYRYHFDLFPVIEGGALIGCAASRDVRKVPREQWDTTRLGDIMAPCTPEITIGPDDDAVAALSQMKRTGNSRLMVTEGRRLIGVIALRDLLEFLALKMDLDQAA